jgi:hypothetical protein
MAEGYLRHAAGDRYEAMSGIDPKVLNPLAVEAMSEIGIDVSRQHSKDVGFFLESISSISSLFASTPEKSALSFRAPTSSCIGVSMTRHRPYEHMTSG